MKDISKYDPTRKTLGAIYRDAQMGYNGTPILVGDMSYEMKKSLVDDLNETIASDPYQGRAFYITVHEKKDLQMKSCLARRLITTLYRPYPEDDTVVFWVEPKSNEVRFCWCLPHWTSMDDMLKTHGIYADEMMTDIKAWKKLDLYHFGFIKDEMGNWKENPNWNDQKLVDQTGR